MKTTISEGMFPLRVHSDFDFAHQVIFILNPQSIKKEIEKRYGKSVDFDVIPGQEEYVLHFKDPINVLFQVDDGDYFSYTFPSSWPLFAISHFLTFYHFFCPNKLLQFNPPLDNITLQKFCTAKPPFFKLTFPSEGLISILLGLRYTDRHVPVYVEPDQSLDPLFGRLANAFGVTIDYVDVRTEREERVVPTDVAQKYRSSAFIVQPVPGDIWLEQMQEDQPRTECLCFRPPNGAKFGELYNVRNFTLCWKNTELDNAENLAVLCTSVRDPVKVICFQYISLLRGFQIVKHKLEDRVRYNDFIEHGPVQLRPGPKPILKVSKTVNGTFKEIKSHNNNPYLWKYRDLVFQVFIQPFEIRFLITEGGERNYRFTSDIKFSELAAFLHVQDPDVFGSFDKDLVAFVAEDGSPMDGFVIDCQKEFICIRDTLQLPVIVQYGGHSHPFTLSEFCKVKEIADIMAAFAGEPVKICHNGVTLNPEAYLAWSCFHSRSPIFSMNYKTSEKLKIRIRYRIFTIYVQPEKMEDTLKSLLLDWFHFENKNFIILDKQQNPVDSLILLKNLSFNDEDLFEIQCTGVVKQLLKLTSSCPPSKKFHFDDTLASLHVKLKGWDFFHHGEKVLKDMNNSLSDIPRIGIIECLKKERSLLPMPTGRIPINILFPGQEELTSGFYPPEKNIRSLINELCPSNDNSFVLQSISTHEIIDSTLALNSIPRPRDLFLVKQMTITLTGQFGTGQRITITERSIFDDLKTQSDGIIVNNLGFIPDSSLFIHPFGTTFTTVIPSEIITVQVQMDNSPVRSFQFKQNSPVRNLRSTIAAFR
jgi:hypothetical protein